MKKSELLFSALLVPVDFLMIFLAGIFAYYFRFSEIAMGWKPVIFDLPLREYLWLLIGASFFILIIFTIAGLYNLKLTRKLVEEFFHITIAISAGVAAIILFTFSIQTPFESRFIVFIGWAAAIILVTIGRWSVRTLQRRASKFGYGVHRVLLVGSNGVVKVLSNEIKNKSELGYRLSGVLEKITSEDLQRAYEKGIDEIIQCNPELSKEKSLELIEFCQENHLDFKFIPDLFETFATNVEVSTFAGMPIVELKKTPLDGWGKIMKRLIDITSAFLGLIILFPFFLLVALIIKIDSKGNVFVKLKRISRGKEFYLYKFRSMIQPAGHPDAEHLKKDLMQYNERQGTPLFKMKDDPRITKIGKFLRQTRIDEFPQLFNVFKGEISLVGPRPHQPDEVARYEKQHKKLLTIKAGITGLAQISGSSDLPFEEEFRLDTYYIENWSLQKDFIILLRTLMVLFRDKSAC